MTSMVYVFKNHDGALPTIKAYHAETDKWNDWGNLDEYSEKVAESAIRQNGYKLVSWNLWGHAEGFGQIIPYHPEAFNHYGTDMYDDRDDWVDDEEIADS